MMFNIQRTTFKVSDFIQWYESKTLILSPDFQRRSVWNNKSRSFLIDTIVRGLPIPVIILRDVKTDIKSYVPKKEVVDGQQRLRTVISFVTGDLEGSFRISKSHNAKLGGLSFEDLSEEMKQRILDYEFFVHVLSSSVLNREILEIFSRMNSTGLKLNEQELRNSSYFGEFKSVAFTLANQFYDYWINWKVFTESKIARMEEVEFVNDMLIIAIDGIVRRSPEAISKYYHDYDEEDSISNLELIKERLINIMGFIDDSIGDFIPTSAFRKTTLLYALIGYIYYVEFGFKDTSNTKSKISLKKSEFKQKVKRISDKILESQREWKLSKKTGDISETIFNAFTSGTNTKENRDIVLNFIKEN